MKSSDFRDVTDKVRLINFRVFEANLARLFGNLDSDGFEPILIKGWAAAQFYPQPWRRSAGDVDLAFPPGKVEAVKKYLDDYQTLPIDIHAGLRHLDTVGFSDLYKNSVALDCQGTSIRVLRPEDHLRVLCVHWMTDGGANKEKLWDIFYLIEQNRLNFDWERCLQTVSRRRRLWIQSIILITHEYLGLEINDLPFEPELKSNTHWIQNVIEKEWRSGIPLISLDRCLGNKKMLYQQIRKRIPPNSLQAITELEKDINLSYLLPYQLLNIFTRLKPSARRILKLKQ